MWKNCVENAYEHISLHDCVANGAVFTDDVLSFTFDDGFWVLADSKYNSCNETVRTDKSELNIIGFDKETAELYVFKKHYVFGKHICTTREELSIDKLIDNVRKGVWKIEFTEQFFANSSMLFYGGINTQKEIWAFEFQLCFYYETTEYRWNNILTDRKW